MRLSQLDSSSLAQTRCRRVLVVDRDEDQVLTLMELLAMHGFEVAGATDGRRALATAEVFDPHVVLMDLCLPGIKGCDAARALRSSERTKNAVIVAITGYDGAEEREQSAAAGVDIHLAKPVALSDLLRAVADSEVHR